MDAIHQRPEMCGAIGIIKPIRSPNTGILILHSKYMTQFMRDHMNQFFETGTGFNKIIPIFR